MRDGNIAVLVQQMAEPIEKQSLIEAAITYLRQAGIRLPHARLEVRDNMAVLQGVPFTGGELLVCAYDGEKINNYL